MSILHSSLVSLSQSYISYVAVEPKENNSEGLRPWWKPLTSLASRVVKPTKYHQSGLCKMPDSRNSINCREDGPGGLINLKRCPYCNSFIELKQLEYEDRCVTVNPSGTAHYCRGIAK